MLVSQLLASRSAWASDCTVSEYYPVSRARDPALLEAGALASNGQYADARAVYLWVLARHARDAEALFGLARVDAWGACWAMAEREYRDVLAEHPKDSDVRAGYVDLLVWSGRLALAERSLEEGLAIDPASPGLVARAARFASWRGDATAAIELADRAEAAAPDDGDLRAMRDRMFVGEARLTAHVDAYPPGYQSLYSLGAQIMGRSGRFEFYGGAELLARYTGSNANSPVRDGRYPFGVAYHPLLGMTVGAEVAPGAPAEAIPRISLKAWVIAPIVGRFDAFFAYSFWHYDHGGEIVQILNPSLGVTLPREFRLDLRAWISAVSLPGSGSLAAQARVEGAAGLGLGWTATPRLGTGITYTYGAEADQAIAIYQLLEYQAHSATAFVDILLGRHGGLRPLVGFEYRLPAHIAIWSSEISAYGRW